MEHPTIELDDLDMAGGPSGGTAPSLAAPLVRPSQGPSPFEVSLKTYSMQPWTAKGAHLRQWFNYGLNPTTWTQYSLRQMELLAASKAAFGPESAAPPQAKQRRTKK